MKTIVPSDDLHHCAGNQELCHHQAIDRRSLTLANNVDSIHLFLSILSLILEINE
jgi:hypothetical protein